MTVTPLPIPVTGDVDAPLSALASEGDGSGAPAFARALLAAFGGASDALDRADASERAYLSGAGELQTMVLDRARADVALSFASAATSRASQALSTILGMAV